MASMTHQGETWGAVNMSVTEPLKEISARYNLGAVYAFGSRAAEIAGRMCGTPPFNQR